jgi:hypothetical protein
MRRACRALVCAAILVAALCAPAAAATTNGQLAAVTDGRLVTLNPDGSGLRVLPVTDAGQITELAFSPGGNRLAFVKAGELSVIELATGRTLALATAAANPGWTLDGLTIAFRRGLSIWRVPAAGGDPQPDVTGLLAGTSDIAWRPGAKDHTPVVLGLLQLLGLDLPPAVTGIPAWAPDEHAVAYARSGGLSVITPRGDVRAVAEGAAGSPRWSPDSGALVFAAGAELRTLQVAGGQGSTPLTGAEPVGAVDWQPCVPNVTLSCTSVSPPRCSALTASATTQADQAVDRPAPPCTDPASRPLSLVVTKPPEHGTVSGLRYTPVPGFVGQDTVFYRVNNGVLDSETFRVTVFVVPRPAITPAPATRPPVLVQGAPFLSASATPRLNRRRTTLVKVSCDQDCSFTIRLSAKLRTRKSFAGPKIRRSLTAKQVVRLRLRLPSRPRGRLKTVWVTGKVRNAAGDARRVKLPVRLPR